MIPNAQVVIVTTPQDVALLDCKKGIELFVQKNIKILGIVENMSGHICSHCGNIDNIFGENGADSLSKKNTVRLKDIVERNGNKIAIIEYDLNEYVSGSLEKPLYFLLISASPYTFRHVQP